MQNPSEFTRPLKDRAEVGERVLPMPNKLFEALMARKTEQAADERD